MGKPKLASDWMAGCSGCHMSLLDIDERIIDLIDLVEIRATPITDLKEPDKDGVDIGILEGGVNNTSNEKQAYKMRARCKILVAFGDCAVFGGIPAMRNFFEIEEVLRRAYLETESTDNEGMIPNDPELGKPTPVRTLEEIVPVDIYLPGCPPDPDAIFYVLVELANGRLPVLKDKYLHWH